MISREEALALFKELMSISNVMELRHPNLIVLFGKLEQYLTSSPLDKYIEETIIKFNKYFCELWEVHKKTGNVGSELKMFDALKGLSNSNNTITNALRDKDREIAILINWNDTKSQYLIEYKEKLDKIEEVVSKTYRNTECDINIKNEDKLDEIQQILEIKVFRQSVTTCHQVLLISGLRRIGA